MTVWRLLCFRSLRWNVFTTVVLVSGSQFVGVNVASVFLKWIYETLSLSTKAISLIPLAGTMIVQMMLLTTIFTIETLGRKFLLLTGLLICTLSNIALAFSLQVQVGNPTTLCTRVTWVPPSFLPCVCAHTSSQPLKIDLVNFT
ncbi:solute carrier family 2, facilitated glucose transporter member 5-like isoform X1 [Candoia aspera]|uniref:solute carrier family 2, facilitated glucose transporter member 5-like isoform X1 n=1 Tax=Candoia aspera TaxID=51853 RepID=UPI002FD80238